MNAFAASMAVELVIIKTALRTVVRTVVFRTGDHTATTVKRNLVFRVAPTWLQFFRKWWSKLKRTKVEGYQADKKKCQTNPKHIFLFQSNERKNDSNTANKRGTMTSRLRTMRWYQYDNYSLCKRCKCPLKYYRILDYTVQFILIEVSSHVPL